MVGVGSFISLSSIVASSFITNYSQFTILYGLLPGIGFGINYITALMCAWEHFPMHRGRMTGLIVGAFGCSPFLFTYLSTYLVNPNNRTAGIYINENLQYFEEDVSTRVPYMLRTLSCIWFVFCLFSIILISRPNDSE